MPNLANGMHFIMQPAANFRKASRLQFSLFYAMIGIEKDVTQQVKILSIKEKTGEKGVCR